MIRDRQILAVGRAGDDGTERGHHGILDAAGRVDPDQIARRAGRDEVVARTHDLHPFAGRQRRGPAGVARPRDDALALLEVLLVLDCIEEEADLGIFTLHLILLVSSLLDNLFDLLLGEDVLLCGIIQRRPLEVGRV